MLPRFQSIPRVLQLSGLNGIKRSANGAVS